LPECRIVRCHQCLCDEANHLFCRERVPESLEQEVADHSLCFGHQGVEGVRMGEGGIPGAFQRQEANLGSIAVRDDQVVVEGERGQSFHSRDYVLLLNLGSRCFAALEECIAAQGDDDPHD
jgi:hypothetical protein